MPKASRGEAGKKFATILDAVVGKNDHASWVRLLYFSTRCLGRPDRGGRRRSLATAVNRQLREEADPPPGLGPTPRRGLFSPDDSLKYLAARVSAKLEEGDFKGAVRLASSDDTLAPMNDATFQALQEKHSPPHPDTSIPSITELQPQHTIIVAVEKVARAIQSFPTSSAGGPDGLRPQHLKDMLSDDSSRHVFLPALAFFVQLVLEGRTPTSIRPFFFGANLTALLKKQGGVRPISVSCTLRRLVAKVAGSKVMEEMGDLLAPQQLGFGVKGGAEAAVHALRLYLCDPNPGKAVLKLDFQNAFNSICRDKMLDAVREHVPELHPFIHSAYSLPSSLFWSDKTIQSAEGVQQGDPLGPLLFCLSIHHMGTQLESELSLLYLDDGTLGGSMENLRHDLEVVEQEGARMGLQLSREKSEIICDDPDTVNSILQFLPGPR